MSMPSFFGRSLMWPLEAITSNRGPRYFLIVLAFAGDSTTTRVLPIVGSLSDFLVFFNCWPHLFDGRSREGPLLLRSPRRASRAPQQRPEPSAPTRGQWNRHGKPSRASPRRPQGHRGEGGEGELGAQGRGRHRARSAP